jgi:hypothetical protein
LWRRTPGPHAWALLLSGLGILFIPFSTFREPLGLVRAADGLVLAVLAFASASNSRRALNYSLFWAAMLVMLVRR